LYHFRHNAAEILTILYNFVPAAVPADALASVPSKKLAEMGSGAREQIAGPTADRVGTYRKKPRLMNKRGVSLSAVSQTHPRLGNG
jgi:hypothetical protein